MFGRELAYRHVLDHAQAGAAGSLPRWSRAAPVCEACESLISRQQASLRYALSRAAGSRAYCASVRNWSALGANAMDLGIVR